MAVKVFLLHGGIISTDGVITSMGMNYLVSMLRELPNTTVQSYLWGNWTRAYNDIMMLQKGELREDKIVLVGYSGGAMKCTWIANGCVLGVDGQVHYQTPPPHIDLMVAYDPSPAESVQSLHENVKKAICYHNLHPFMFGLGGGALHGPHVELVPISEQHLMVQFDGALHRRTVDEVRKLL